MCTSRGRGRSVAKLRLRRPLRSDGERGADLAITGHEMQRARRHAGLVQKTHRLGGDERALLGRLGHHRVAGHKRRAHLAEEIESGKFHGLMQTNTPRPR